MTERLDQIITILQKSVYALPQNHNTGEDVFLALAELKQVRDILGGFLSSDTLSFLPRAT